MVDPKIITDDGEITSSLEFLALYANNMLEARRYRNAACVYRLLAKKQPNNLRWSFSVCYSLICSEETEEAKLSFMRLKRLALSGEEAKTRSMLEKFLHYTRTLNVAQQNRHSD